MDLNINLLSGIVVINSIEEVLDVVIFNESGEMVLKEKSFSFSIKSLKKGFYTISVKTKSGITTHNFMN